jgi:hypothetical protein
LEVKQGEGDEVLREVILGATEQGGGYPTAG